MRKVLIIKRTDGGIAVAMLLDRGEIRSYYIPGTRGENITLAFSDGGEIRLLPVGLFSEEHVIVLATHSVLMSGNEAVTIEFSAEGLTERIPVWEKNPDYVSWRVASTEDLPGDREFRNAWCDETPTKTVDIDLAKAKEIALAKLRKDRDVTLAELDKQTVIAVGKGDEAARILIESQKQELRDATEPLKRVSATGYNDSDTLNKLRNLSVLKGR